MGKRRKRRKYKDVSSGNLGVNQALEYMNPNIITEKQLIILIILKILSEKLNQNNSMLNKDFQLKKEEFYQNPLSNIDKASEDKILDFIVTDTKLDGEKDDKNQEVMLMLEDKGNLQEVDIKESSDFTENNVLDLNKPEENVYNELQDSNTIIHNIKKNTTEKFKCDLRDLKENLHRDQNQYKNNESKIICKSKARVKKTTLLICCENEYIKSSFCLEEAVCKVPVVLSEIEIPIFIVAIEEFKEPIFKITSLDKRAILKKCHLVAGANKLFIKGVIEESIEYSTVNYYDKDSIKGNIKRLVLNIPFKCSTEVSFFTEPKFYNNSYLLNIRPLIEDISSIGTYEKYQGDLEHISDKIFYNLKSIRILEMNNKQCVKSSEDMLEQADTFKRIEKKIILVLKITLLQNQNVFHHNKDKES